MGPVSHQLYILRCAIGALTVSNRSLEHITELCARSEKVWSHEVYHTPVLYQIILKWISGEYDSPSANTQTSVKRDWDSQLNVF